MGIEKITSKILAEADEVREQLMKEARGQYDAVLSEAAEKCDAIKNENEKNGREEKEKIISRRRSVAEIDSRKIILAGKQEVISACFDKAVDEIMHMDEEKYVDFLVKLAMKSGMQSGTLIFNEKERDSIGVKVTEKLNAASAGECSAEKFVLSDEKGSMKGGYMLRYKLTYIDNTIEALVKEYKPELMAEAARQLFTEDNI